MKANFLFFNILCFLLSCSTKEDKQGFHSQQLTIEQANKLIKLPLKCIQQEYPNKTGQVLSSAEDLGRPSELHPAFYGCFNWHSSVHGHWVMVKLINDFPNIENKDSIINLLKRQISKENIEKEVNYFNRNEEKSFERTYGWVWLLKLALEIKQSKNPKIKILDTNLKPLTQLIVKRYLSFLPKLNYPLRNGTHTNTAFGLTFAYDYAVYTKDTKLKEVITKESRRMFLKDADCGINWEPSGTDFLSPCLEEIDLMRRVLSKKKFIEWCHIFMPQLEFPHYSLEVGIVSDRTDGQLVHLDGLNFSRAWVLYGLAKQYPEEYGHLRVIANKHLNYSLPSLVDGNYEGEHWLVSFALYALSEQ